MISESPDWAAFIELTGGGDPRPHLMKAATLLRREHADGELLEALDFACGAGRDTEYLLNHDFRVTAVDSSPVAASALRRLPHQRWLSFVESRMEDFVPQTYDLINAQYALPFIQPDALDATMHKLVNALKPKGVLACNFFGPEDEWNQPGSPANFQTQEQVEGHIKTLTTVTFDEENSDGHTADGTPKHWHIFHLIAQRQP